MLKIITALCLTLAILLSCKSKEKVSGAAAELIRLNDLYDSALLFKKQDVLERLYAKDFLYTNPDGKVLTKEQQMTTITASEMKWDSGKSEDVKVRLYGKIAVINGAFHASGNYRGNPVTINERYMVIWLKTDTSWQMIAEQGNIIK
jgi:hypothetical protein